MRLSADTAAAAATTNNNTTKLNRGDIIDEDVKGNAGILDENKNDTHVMQPFSPNMKLHS